MERETNEALVERSSGNVYADLDHADADEKLAKAHLVGAIVRIVRQDGLSQEAAAALMGIDQPKVSQLLRGHFKGFSSDRLMHFLALLGQDVTITVKPHEPNHGSTGRVWVSVTQTDGP